MRCDYHLQGIFLYSPVITGHCSIFIKSLSAASSCLHPISVPDLCLFRFLMFPGFWSLVPHFFFAQFLLTKNIKANSGQHYWNVSSGKRVKSLGLPFAGSFLLGASYCYILQLLHIVNQLPHLMPTATGVRYGG